MAKDDLSIIWSEDLALLLSGIADVPGARVDGATTEDLLIKHRDATMQMLDRVYETLEAYANEPMELHGGMTERRIKYGIASRQLKFEYQVAHVVKDLIESANSDREYGHKVISAEILKQFRDELERLLSEERRYIANQRAILNNESRKRHTKKRAEVLDDHEQYCDEFNEVLKELEAGIDPKESIWGSGHESDGFAHTSPDTTSRDANRVSSRRERHLTLVDSNNRAPDSAKQPPTSGR